MRGTMRAAAEGNITFLSPSPFIIVPDTAVAT
jgi:hypothetical protein